MLSCSSEHEQRAVQCKSALILILTSLSDPLAHHAECSARVLISMFVGSFYMHGDYEEKFSHSVSIFIYVYISMDSSHSRRPCASSGTGMLLIEANRFGLVFFRFMDLSGVVYIIWTLKPVHDLRPPNEMAFLVLVSGFTFGGILSILKIYELKQQFPKLAPWNMHWPTVHLL